MTDRERNRYDQGWHGPEDPYDRMRGQERWGGQGYDRGRYAGREVDDTDFGYGSGDVGRGEYSRDYRYDRGVERGYSDRMGGYGRMGGRGRAGGMAEYGRQGYGGQSYGPQGGYGGYGREGSMGDYGDQGFGREGDYGRVGGYGGQTYDQQGSYGGYGQQRGQHTGRGPKGYQRSDDRICEDVCEILTQHGAIDAREIEVDVNNGEVTLRGTVDSRQAKRMAEDALESLPGIKDVHNQLRVSQVPTGQSGTVATTGMRDQQGTQQRSVGGTTASTTER